MEGFNCLIFIRQELAENCELIHLLLNMTCGRTFRELPQHVGKFCYILWFKAVDRSKAIEEWKGPVKLVRTDPLTEFTLRHAIVSKLYSLLYC